MSLIADSLKKAVKEKSFNVNPGINLLKNLGGKPKLKPKEVKRFIILIVIPATILVYLLLANPFDPNKRARPKSAPVVAKAPLVAPVKPVTPVSPVIPVAPVPQPSPSQPNPLPAKEPDSIQVIEPGMTEVTVLETEIAAPEAEIAALETEIIALESEVAALESANKEVNPKPVPGPKNKSEKTMTRELASVASLTPEKPAVKVPKTSATTSAPETGEMSISTPREPNTFKDSDYYFNRAIFYQQSRNWEKALTNYSKAAELDASNPDIYNNIGVIYKELRQYDRAIEEFLTAAQLNPDYAKPYNNIGVVYYAKKDFANAIRNYQKAVSIDPENLEALNNLAVAYKHIDQLERSKSVLNQALKINPAHAGTHYNLAVLYEEEGNIESAIHFYQRFVDLASLSHPTLFVQVKKHLKTLK